jgi:hypothetical protein
MPDLSALHVFPSTGRLLVTFPVSPEEIELAFATNWESLRLKTLTALVAELATVGRPESKDALAQWIPWSNDVGVD